MRLAGIEPATPAFGGLIGWAASGSPWGALATAASLALLLASARGWVLEAISKPFVALRQRNWQHREGVHYTFAGVSLDVHDDGHQVWMHERGLRQLLQLERDPEKAFKARFTGQWREPRELGLKGVGLWLNATAVRQHLADAPERMNPKRVKLRAYLDREILQPAVRRHERGL